MKTDVGTGALAIFLNAGNPRRRLLECQDVGVDAPVFTAFVFEVVRTEEEAVLFALSGVVGVATVVDGDFFRGAGGLIECLAGDDGSCEGSSRQEGQGS